jgi:predicted XRE-type DNA-binding protein
MKKQNFPSEEELLEIRTLLNDGPASRALPKNASAIDRVKYALCEQFIIYKQVHKISQREFANELGIDESIISKILHYNFDECTVDRLMRYLEILHKEFVIKSDLHEVNIRVA